MEDIFQFSSLFRVKRVKIPNPRIYVHCPKQIYQFPPNHDNVNTYQKIGDTKWMPLKSTLRLKSSLSVDIPRGLQSNYPWVAFVTIALSWISMIYFIKRVINISKHLGINPTLE